MKQSVQSWKRMVPAVAGASLLLGVWGNASEASPVPASDRSATLDRIENYSNRSDRIQSQVNSVSQLRDVSPGDWAFEALRNLVETYGCIEGYPDQTYRGDRALTRYEFAAGLNSCLQAIEQQQVSQEDLQTLQRLVEEFEAELATLGTRVDNLEGRVATLEENQFSTTAKLSGTVVFTLAKAFDADSVGTLAGQFENLTFDGEPRTNAVQDETVFGNRAVLAITSSFTGRDELAVEYEARNIESFGAATTGTDMTALDLGGGNNDIVLDALAYEFPLGQRTRVFIGAAGVDADEGAIRPLNPLFRQDNSGSLSSMLQRDQLVFGIPQDFSVGTSFDFSDALSLGLFYGVGGDARNPRPGGEGLFQGNTGALAQLRFEPNDSIDLAFTYAHTYTDSDFKSASSVVGAGSPIGQQPFGSLPTTSDRFGLQSNFQIGQDINFALWGSYANADPQVTGRRSVSLDPSVNLIAADGDNADLWSVGATLSFLDLAREGDRLGVGVAIPPKVAASDATLEDTSSGNTAAYEDEGTSVLVEGQYRYPITERLHITPGGYALINPNHNSDSDTVFVGVLRTEFAF